MKATLKMITIARKRNNYTEPANFWFMEGFSIYVQLDEVRRFIEKRRKKIKRIEKTEKYCHIHL